jgi:hypothetical protein
MSDKTHWKKYFNYNYFGTYSLDDYEGDPILTIKSIGTEEVKDQNGKAETCMVCHWSEDEKPLILNKTNCKIIQFVYNSPHIEDWIGKRVQLYMKNNVKAFGAITTGIRIRDFVPAGNDLVKKKALQKEIRTALDSYKGDDMGSIKEMLKAKVQAKEDSIRFYEGVLVTLKNPA